MLKAQLGPTSYQILSSQAIGLPLGERALALARGLGADEIIIQCLCTLASNRPHDAGRAYIYIGEALIYLGRYEQARHSLMDALTYTRRMHVPYIAEAASRMLAEVDWLTGRWSAAITQLLPVVGRAGSEQPESLSQIYLGLVHARLYNDLGQAENAHELLSEALAGPVNTLDPRVALLGEFVQTEATLGRPRLPRQPRRFWNGLIRLATFTPTSEWRC